ncbi:hypothetical protein [Geothrix sp. PMB-07]|uniref:hypothetical protein n=1 Tax=Geothrix sp. PMB-07 TaxID=3068640 RepID=UPI00274253B3|nr:hypothetical protein [Geothrix sp. PMB-07]WLT33016.1 hypothetical protein Q9293_06725 [Geothrix sp. PMB-07]
MTPAPSGQEAQQNDATTSGPTTPLAFFKVWTLEVQGDPAFQAMTDADLGFLIRCKCVAARSGGFIPADGKALGRLLSRRSDHALKSLSRVAFLFAEDPSRPGFLLIPSVLSEVAAYAKKCGANRENGKTGGRPRKNPVGSCGETQAVSNKKKEEEEKKKNPPKAPRGTRKGEVIVTFLRGEESASAFEMTWKNWPASKHVDRDGNESMRVKRGDRMAAERCWQAIVDSGEATPDQLRRVAELYVTKHPKVAEGFVQHVSTFLAPAGGRWAEGLRTLRAFEHQQAAPHPESAMP